MSDRPQADLPEIPSGDGEPIVPARKPPRTPADTLTSAMIVYILINLLWAIPMVSVPESFFDLILREEPLAGQFDGLRWLGAVLLAWAISGILVLARPEGRAIFVTTGALQLTFAALVSLYTWSIDPEQWEIWYHIVGSGLFGAGAIYMWWARLRARQIFKGQGAT